MKGLYFILQFILWVMLVIVLGIFLGGCELQVQLSIKDPQNSPSHYKLHSSPLHKSDRLNVKGAAI